MNLACGRVLLTCPPFDGQYKQNGILKIRKGKWNMSKYYSAEFKLEAVKRVQKSGDPVARIAAELEIMKTPCTDGSNGLVKPDSAISR